MAMNGNFSRVGKEDDQEEEEEGEEEGEEEEDEDEEGDEVKRLVWYCGHRQLRQSVYPEL